MDESKLKELEFSMKYYDKMIKAIKAKKSFLPKIYNWGYAFVIQLSFIAAGILLTKTSLFADVGFIVCLIIGSFFLAKPMSDSENLKSFEEDLKKSSKIL